jgi:hypothetical protein
MKGIQKCSNKGPGPLQKGDDYKNTIFRCGHWKIFSRTTKSEKLRFTWHLSDIVQIQVCSNQGPQKTFLPMYIDIAQMQDHWWSERLRCIFWNCVSYRPFYFYLLMHIRINISVKIFNVKCKFLDTVLIQDQWKLLEGKSRVVLLSLQDLSPFIFLLTHSAYRKSPELWTESRIKFVEVKVLWGGDSGLGGAIIWKSLLTSVYIGNIL